MYDNYQKPLLKLMKGTEEWICNNCGNHFMVSTLEREFRIIKDQPCPQCKKVDTDFICKYHKKEGEKN